MRTTILSVSKLYSLVWEPDLIIFSVYDRLIFQILLWPIVIIGAIGNASVLCRIILLPGGRFTLLKPFYRCALISFALSDVMLLLASGVHTLSKVSFKVNLLWKLPDWTCSTIPFIQTVAIIAGSLILASIAVDRYRALIPKYPKSEKPKWFKAIIFNIFIWLFASTISYPVIGIYEIDVFTVLGEDSTIYEGRVCSTDQIHTGLIYTALFIIIFVPLTIIFLIVHILLMLNIWRRQSQPSKQPKINKMKCNDGHDSQSTEVSSVSNTVHQQHQKGKKTKQPRHQPAPTRSPPSNHMKRKKRTLNVILVLIVVFLIGRLPSWMFLLCKQYLRLSSEFWHYVQITFTSLTLLNAALDPFLYAFLCEALSLLGFLRACCVKIKRIKTADITTDLEYARAPNVVTPTIVPRGPYNF